MKHHSLLVLLLLLTGAGNRLFAQTGSPDTVRVGIYITSVHDIDFRQKEYSVNFWLWLSYTNPELNFMQNLEVPQAKSINKSYAVNDTVDGRITTLMKIQCVMKDSWRITHFPFDRQRLFLSLENAQFDTRSLVFVADTSGMHFDPRFTISGWNIDSFDISTGIKAYETAFGDKSIGKPHSEYATFKVKLGIKRSAWGLFFKIFLGMYISCLIAFVCFFIHADNIDSRFGLSVGSLFAAIGNKYVVDSSLPETSSFTLVDTLHSITLVFILGVITASVHSLRLKKDNQLHKANKFDERCAKLMMLAYVAVNTFFIMRAVLS